jgi:uncharacterized iron-regulated membrane protein
VSLRRVLFWSHLIVGLAVGAAVAFLAATGILMSYQPQITRLVEASVRPSSVPGTCESLSSVLSTARKLTSSSGMTVTVFSNPATPTLFTARSDKVYLVNPCTGALLSPKPSGVRAFFSRVKDLHQRVAFGGLRHESLRAVKDAANLLFAFLIVSGIVLWVPRQWRASNLRAASLLRVRLKGRARDWNWHNVAGIWCAISLLIISLTGTVMAYGWANNLLYRLSGTPVPKAPEERRAGGPSAEDLTVLDALLPIAEAQDNHWQSISIRLPQAADKTVSFTIDDRLDNRPSGRTSLTLSREGKIMRWEPFASVSKGRRWRVYVRFLHTGELFGVAGQTVVFFSALALLVLVWTGISLSIRRFASWRQRKKRMEEKQVAIVA